MNFTPDEIALAACQHWNQDLKEYLTDYEYDTVKERVKGYIAYGQGLAIHEILMKLLPVEKVEKLYHDTAYIETKSVDIDNNDYVVTYDEVEQ